MANCLLLSSCREPHLLPLRYAAVHFARHHLQPLQVEGGESPGCHHSKLGPRSSSAAQFPRLLRLPPTAAETADAQQDQSREQGEREYCSAFATTTSPYLTWLQLCRGRFATLWPIETGLVDPLPAISGSVAPIPLGLIHSICESALAHSPEGAYISKRSLFHGRESGGSPSHTLRLPEKIGPSARRVLGRKPAQETCRPMSPLWRLPESDPENATASRHPPPDQSWPSQNPEPWPASHLLASSPKRYSRV